MSECKSTSKLDAIVSIGTGGQSRAACRGEALDPVLATGGG